MLDAAMHIFRTASDNEKAHWITSLIIFLIMVVGIGAVLVPEALIRAFVFGLALVCVAVLFTGFYKVVLSFTKEVILPALKR